MRCIIAYDDTGNICAITQDSIPSWWDASWHNLTIDDTMNPSATEVWNSGQISLLYVVSNGAIVKSPNYASLQLSQAKQIKTAELRTGYQQTLAGGFNVTIGGTQYTFGWSTDDKANLTALQKAIDQGFLTFPVQYADIHGNPVTIPDQTTLNNLEATATRFFNAQHQQMLNLIAQVQAANTVDAVNAIQWDPATY